MAFALTNKSQLNPSAPGQPGVLHYEFADQTAISAQNTGVAGLKFIRVRILIKSGMANTNTALFAVRVGTSTAVTGPELVALSPTYTFVTNDTNLTWEGYGYSQTGYQSFKIDVTNGTGTASFDAIVDCW